MRIELLAPGGAVVDRFVAPPPPQGGYWAETTWVPEGWPAWGPTIRVVIEDAPAPTTADTPPLVDGPFVCPCGAPDCGFKKSLLADEWRKAACRD
jgi:hypothetical protein